METLFSRLRVKTLLYDSDIQKILHCVHGETTYVVHAIFCELDPDLLKILMADGFEYTREEGVSYFIRLYDGDCPLEQSILRGKVSAEQSDGIFKAYKRRVYNLRNLSYNVLSNVVDPANLALSNEGQLKIYSEFKLSGIRRETYLSEVLHMIGEFMEMLYFRNPIISEGTDPISPMIKEIAGACQKTEFISVEQWLERCEQIIFLSDEKDFLGEDPIEKKSFQIRNRKNFILLVVATVLLLMLIILGIRSLFKGDKSKDMNALSLEENKGGQAEAKAPSEEGEPDNKAGGTDEDLDLYYSETMKNMKEDVATLDTSVAYEGNSSLFYESKEESKEVFFADINFNHDKYQALKGKDIMLSFWANANKEQSIDVVITIYEKDQLVGKTQTKIFVTAGSWGQNRIKVRLGTGDRIEMYLKPMPNTGIWVDEIALSSVE